MRIKGTEHTAREVSIEISEHELYEALRKKVYASLGIPADAYLSLEDQIVEDDDCGHGSPIVRVIVDKPSQNQLQTIKAFRHIHAMMLRD